MKNGELNSSHLPSKREKNNGTKKSDNCVNKLTRICVNYDKYILKVKVKILHITTEKECNFEYL